MTEIQVTLLGTGSSGGVPRIGNDWGACNPDNPKNRRTRCGAYVQVRYNSNETISFLIDTAPELREQLIRSNISDVDAVLYTHAHADQCHGIDDLRVLSYIQKKRLPIYANRETMDDITSRFAYCFETPPDSNYPPVLKSTDPFEYGTPLRLSSLIHPNLSVDVLPLKLRHGSIDCTGFRVGRFAYCNDVNEIYPETFEDLKGLEILVIDCLRHSYHPSHANLETVLEWVERTKPKQTYLTNMHVDLDYDALCSELPDSIRPGYDGMTATLEFP